MSEKKTRLDEGYTPRPTQPEGREVFKKGYVPEKAEGGHVPLTGTGAPTNPPNQGGGGQKKK